MTATQTLDTVLASDEKGSSTAARDPDGGARQRANTAEGTLGREREK